MRCAWTPRVWFVSKGGRDETLRWRGGGEIAVGGWEVMGEGVGVEVFVVGDFGNVRWDRRSVVLVRGVEGLERMGGLGGLEVLEVLEVLEELAESSCCDILPSLTTSIHRWHVV